MAAGSGDERASRIFKKTERYAAEVALLGANVRTLRLRRGWTLEHAAENMQVDLKHLQKVESGQLNVTLVTLVRIADGLGVQLRALFAARRTTKVRR